MNKKENSDLTTDFAIGMVALSSVFLTTVGYFAKDYFAIGLGIVFAIIFVGLVVHNK